MFLASNYRSSSSLSVTDRGFLARKTATELLSGAIGRVTRWEQVAAILPLFVATNEAGKQRIIFDARALNALLSESRGSVRYESVRDALVTAAVCTKLDVASAFRHVAVEESQRRYMCFEVEGILYRYNTLPFGVSWSPALFYRALAPAIQKIRSALPAGARIVWYVDDLLIVAPDAATLDRALSQTIDTLLDRGWAVSAEKTYPYAFRHITFLGLLADFSGAVPTLRVPSSKADAIQREALALAADPVAVRVHRLQRLAGKLEFVRLVLPQVGLLRRGLDAAIAAGTRALHACVPVATGSRLHADLLAIAHASKTFMDASLSPHDHVARRQLGNVYSDASAFGWGVLHLAPDAPMTAIPPEILSSEQIAAWTKGGEFSERERAMSSGAREVRAIVAGVSALDLRNGDVSWHSDATVAVKSISSWRSKAEDVLDALKELWDLVTERDLRLCISHVLRDAELMPVADWLSRRAWRDRQAEWGMAECDISAICQALRTRRPNADLFASSRNAVARPYCSRWAEVGSIGDAFFVSWNVPGRIWWAFPPISQLSRFCHRLLTYVRMVRTAAETAGGVRRQPHWSVVVVYPVLNPPPSFLVELLGFATRNYLVSLPAQQSRTTIPPADRDQQRPLCPGLRLLDGERRPAGDPPPWPLRAALVHVK